MAFSLSCRSLCISRNPYFSRSRVKQLQLSSQARSQNFSDEGDSSDIVDANMNILRYRMERMRMKERHNAGYKVGNVNGWNYKCRYDDVKNTNTFFQSSIQLATIVFTSIGLVFLTGSLCIFLVSFIFSQSTNSS